MNGGLRVDGLSIRHSGVPMLQDISFAVSEGGSLCLIGASGGGKSLIAAGIAGLLPACMAASGNIRFGGEECAAADQRGLRALWHRHSCLLPQEPAAALAPLLRGVDQLALAPPRLDRAEAFAWLAGFGLDRHAARRLPGALSGGMAQRLLAALAARTPARVLVVDEPTKGLDTESRAELVAALQALRDAGRALVVVTHDLAVVRALDGQLAVLEEGRIQEMGPAESLLREARSRFLRACIAADPILWPSHTERAGGAAVAAGQELVIARTRGRLAGPLQITLREGQVAAVLGPSGIGKTTLGDTLLGLAPPAAGRISWFGRVLDARTQRRLRPRFQKLHQDPSTVFPLGRKLGQSLSDLRGLAGGAEAISRLDGILEQLGVSPALLARRPNEVSGGEAQRLALARLLALRPAMLVADEPGSRLDMPVQAETMRLLRGVADEEGVAVMLITHDEAIATAMADQTVRLQTTHGVVPGR
jgi:peptide/nickel transport system ATP-binding protein